MVSKPLGQRLVGDREGSSCTVVGVSSRLGQARLVVPSELFKHGTGNLIGPGVNINVVKVPVLQEENHATDKVAVLINDLRADGKLVISGR